MPDSNHPFPKESLIKKLQTAYTAMLHTSDWRNALKSGYIADHEAEQKTSVCLRATQLAARGPSSQDFKAERQQVEDRIEITIGLIGKFPGAAEEVLETFLSCCTLFFHEDISVSSIDRVLTQWENHAQNFPELWGRYTHDFKAK